ncbi:MAG: class I SAM-dependent methyltransferase [Anaerolineae bacterium]|nr:class I SAM-dependent methyltransferase [Anaerolineae bacterium]
MKSEAMWDSLAKNWDSPGVSLGQNDIRIIEKTKKYLRASDTILDYGCATGSVALELAGTVSSVHGIDLSSNMIDIARNKAAERARSNAHFMHATIFDERLQPESFDLILSLSILHLVENPSEVVNRIYQLLKPQGKFVVAGPCLGERTLVSILLNLPIFLLSRIGLLPRISFFSVSGLTSVISNEQFQILETDRLSVRPITECFIVARKG